MKDRGRGASEQRVAGEHEWFQSGNLPWTNASRTAARQGRFAKARSERIGFWTPEMKFGAARLQGLSAK